MILVGGARHIGIAVALDLVVVRAAVQPIIVLVAEEPITAAKRRIEQRNRAIRARDLRVILLRLTD